MDNEDKPDAAELLTRGTSPSHWLQVTLLLVTPLILGGCSSNARYVAPSLESTPSLWTVVSVRGAANVPPELQAVVEQAVVTELERGRRLLPLALPPLATQQLEEASVDWQRGPPAHELVSLSRSWGADAMALVSVRHFDPYPPMRLVLSVEVHSTETGTLLFASSHESPDGNTWRPASTLSKERYARSACSELLADLP